MRWLTLVVSAESERRHADLVAAMAQLPVEVISVEEALGSALTPVDEPGAIGARASGRARQIRDATGLVTVAEVGGLEVDALGDTPVASRRSNERTTDADKNALLLSALEEATGTDRMARYRCVLALATPWADEPSTVEACLDGEIARASRGSGFSYEPLFVIPGEACSLAELSEERRTEVSPHAQAARALIPRLVDLLDTLLDATERAIVEGG